jgi:thiamine biosynthesis lipoprotein
VSASALFETQRDALLFEMLHDDPLFASGSDGFALAAAGEEPLLETSFRAMGSEVRALVAASGPRAERRVARVARWFEAWARRLSRFDPQSELSTLNACSGSAVVASPTLRAAMRAALSVAEWSDGLVAPTVLDAVEAAGYDRSFEALVGADRGAPDARAPRDPQTWRGIALDDLARTIALPAGARIDLGGTAKGWAADRAAARLGELGPALVDAGGDLAVSGPLLEGRPWTIAVADPHLPGANIGILAVRGGGVATSGRDYRKWQRGGVWQHHIVDPRTGRPAVTDVLSATVTAPSALEAEAAAKVVVVLGAARGLRWLDARLGLGAIVVCEDGRVLVSEALARSCDLAACDRAASPCAHAAGVARTSSATEGLERRS